MPGLGTVAGARPAVSPPCRHSTFWPPVAQVTHRALRVCRLPLAAPPGEWLVSLADASAGAGPHAAGIAPIPKRHASGRVAVAT
jgi:hypothetical protein